MTVRSITGPTPVGLASPLIVSDQLESDGTKVLTMRVVIIACATGDETIFGGSQGATLNQFANRLNTGPGTRFLAHASV